MKHVAEKILDILREDAETVRIVGMRRGRAYRETVDVVGGYIHEYYHYPTTSHLYLRILRLRYLGREWTAVYIDWDTDSPWWMD